MRRAAQNFRAGFTWTLLAVTVLLFIPAAAVLGETIAGIGDFTKGILGLFVFWVPECVLILAVVLVWNSALSANR